MSKCPRCDSPDPARHPAVQHEGEVQVCPHPFHGPRLGDDGRPLPTVTITPDTSGATRPVAWVTRQLDVDAAARDALDALAMADHHSDPFHKYVARYAAGRRITAAAMDVDLANGPMSEGRAELVITRAELTLAGRHAAADAIGRQLVGVV